MPLDRRASQLLAATVPVVKRWLTSAYPTEITDIATSKPNWVNEERHQLNAPLVMTDLLGRWRQAQGSHSGFLVLVTSDSMYDPRTPSYRFVFGAYPKHESRTQVTNMVATAQMRVFHPEREKARLTKMMLRYIGVRACRLSYNDDPRSVMYNNILSDADLDRMTAKLPKRC